MTETDIRRQPTPVSLRQTARVVLAVVLGGKLEPDGSLTWRGVSDEQRLFALEVSRLAPIAIGLLYGDERIRQEPRSEALDFLAEAMRDPRLVETLIDIAHQVDEAHGRGGHSPPTTMH